MCGLPPKTLRRRFLGRGVYEQFPAVNSYNNCGVRFPKGLTFLGNHSPVLFLNCRASYDRLGVQGRDTGRAAQWFTEHSRSTGLSIHTFPAATGRNPTTTTIMMPPVKETKKP